jgi:Tfp pilus assembly protein PilW
MHCPPHHKLGVSLLEMSITLLLSSGLLLMMWQLYGDIVTSGTRHLQVIQRTPDKLRLATVLQQAINGAGFLGCPRWDARLPVQSLQQRWSFTVNDRLKVYRAQADSWQPALPIELQGKVATGSDVLQIVHGQTEIQHLSAPSRRFELPMSDTSSFTPGDSIAIANCQRAAIAQVGEVSRAYLRLTQPLITDFTPPSTVTRLTRQYFFINRQGALAWQNFDHAAEELLPDSGPLHIQLIAIDRQQQLYFVAPDQIEDRSTVVGVAITIWRKGETQPWQIQIAWHNSAAASYSLV